MLRGRVPRDVDPAERRRVEQHFVRGIERFASKGRRVFLSRGAQSAFITPKGE